MIETIIRAFLADALALPVVLEMPPNPPDVFVLMEKTGSGGTVLLPQATLAVQSYGGSLYLAATLNEQVKATMQQLVQLDCIRRVDCDTDYNFTDPEAKRYRYQAVFTVGHYPTEKG